MTIERQLLARLTDPNEIARVHEMGLRAEVFEEPLSGRVYNWITEYWNTSQQTEAPSAAVIEMQFPGFRVDPADPDLPIATWSAQKLNERFATNNVQELARLAVMTSKDDPIGTLKELQAATYMASEILAPRHSRSNMADNVEERQRRYATAAAGSGGGRGVTLGFPELDDHTNGLLDGELCAVGAYSKVGKTMMLANAAVESRKGGWEPIIYSLEMPISEIEGRVDAMISNVSYNRLSKFRLSEPELEKLHAAQELFKQLGDMRVESPEEGDRNVAHLLARARHSGSNYVLIDQLSFMEETQRFPSEKQRQGSILKQLKNGIGQASRGKLPCVLAVQLRRESLERKEGPELNDFADAAEVERTCDLLIGLSRNKDERASRMMRMQILGGRRCDVATWMLQWDLVDSTTLRVDRRVHGS